jgi:preprotein translocase subunit SecA
MLTKQIEKAQKKVEEQNFLIRKRVLEYDDVMNEQRRIIYAYRDDVLEGKDLGEQAREELDGVMARLVDAHTPGDYVEEWDLDGLFVALNDIMPGDAVPDGVDAQAVAARSPDREALAEHLQAQARELYDQREQQFGDELMRALERYLLLQIIDNRWREHLYDMDYLREGIHLRGFAQIEPIVAYKNEAFDLFTDLMNSIWSDFARMVYHVEVEIEVDDPAMAQQAFGTPAGSQTRAGSVSYTGGSGGLQGAGAIAAAAAGGGGLEFVSEWEDDDELVAAPVVEQRRVSEDEQVGRNDPCWCGSGKKFKKCHGA